MTGGRRGRWPACDPELLSVEGFVVVVDFVCEPLPVEPVAPCVVVPVAPVAWVVGPVAPVAEVEPAGGADAPPVPSAPAACAHSATAATAIARCGSSCLRKLIARRRGSPAG
jgi:hypothetical protein